MYRRSIERIADISEISVKLVCTYVWLSKPYELPDSCIVDVVKNFETISTITDVLKHCPKATYRSAVVILDVLNEVYEDIDITDETYCISAVCSTIKFN